MEAEAVRVDSPYLVNHIDQDSQQGEAVSNHLVNLDHMVAIACNLEEASNQEDKLEEVSRMVLVQVGKLVVDLNLEGKLTVDLDLVGKLVVDLDLEDKLKVIQIQRDNQEEVNRMVPVQVGKLVVEHHYNEL